MAAAQCVQMNAFQLQQLQQVQQQQAQQANSQQQPLSVNSSSQHSSRPIIERGASWSYNETRILLSLWGQDMVQRQLTNSKRTRHVWEKIAERIREHGFERTADQVRTRVFNMIAEYRRILKNPSPERKKKCIFFDALHKIYQAKDTNGVKAALNNYEEDYNLDMDFSVSDENQDQNGGTGDDSAAEDGNGSGNETYEEKSEVFAYAMSPSAALGNGMTNGHLEHEVDDSTDQHDMDSSQYMTGPPPTKRLRSESTASMQQQIPYQNFDNSSAALLIDRMFAHLAKETEVMREWVCLERERLKDEVARRKEEVEREERRERAFLSTLSRMQEQMFTYLSKQNTIGNPSTVNTSSVVSSQSSPCNNNSDDVVESELH